MFKEYGKTLFNSEENKNSLEKVDLVISNHSFYHQLSHNIIVDDVIETYRLEEIKRAINLILMKHTRQESMDNA